jgi:hypothetical protein
VDGPGVITSVRGDSAPGDAGQWATNRPGRNFVADAISSSYNNSQRGGTDRLRGVG